MNALLVPFLAAVSALFLAAVSTAAVPVKFEARRHHVLLLKGGKHS